MMRTLFILIAFLSFGMQKGNDPIELPVLVEVKGGTYLMGGRNVDSSEDEKPKHNVTLSTFSMGKYEVTVAEYKAFCLSANYPMPDTPNWGWIDNHPIVSVSFVDANAYCKWLSEKTGKNYRLPTEAEWEFAARGGTKSKNYIYSGSNKPNEVAWSSENSKGKTQPVGSKKPNELGIYDMNGNAWEWCGDWYSPDYYSKSPSVDPRGPETGGVRVLRGGGWFIPYSRCRVANRIFSPPDKGVDNFGFRVVLNH